MNTVGKMLVLLNFLFAVIIGGLLVVHVAVRNNWKELYLAQKRESEVNVIGRNQDKNVKNKIVNEYSNTRLKIEDLEQKIKSLEEEKAASEDIHKAEIALRDNKLDRATISIKELNSTIKRLGDEIAIHVQTIKEREVTIVKLEADVKTNRIQAQLFEGKFRDAQLQNENLLEQVRGLTTRLAKLEAGVSPDAVVLRNPNEPNPPPVVVNGKLTVVDGDLVQISLGTDQGVNKHHTLDVYRLQPEAKYLGMIRIVDANHRSSVARLVTSGNPSFRPQLKVDDLVTSKLTR